MNKFWNGWKVLVAVFSIGFQSSAWGIVRSITVDESSMSEIHLTMGRSTVLHFLEKPTKVVVGNQNYFNIEFTGNDVTIQPLGYVTSNLFTYGEYHRFGFVLKVGNGEAYDDLLQVRWKTTRVFIPHIVKTAPEAVKTLPVAVSKSTELKVVGAFFEEGSALYVVDLLISDKTGKGLESKDLLIKALEAGKEVPIKKSVFDNEKLEAPGTGIKARLFLSRQGKGRLVLRVKRGKKTLEVSIP